MHKEMLYTWVEMITCTHEPHGGSKAKKSEGREWGVGGMGKEYVVVPLAPNRRLGMYIGDV